MLETRFVEEMSINIPFYYYAYTQANIYRIATKKLQIFVTKLEA